MMSLRKDQYRMEHKMNISKAKQQIRNAVKAYLTRDDLGNYVIPVEKQRPILLVGPPGIGKTAIMEQLASELGIGLISYSMTHHTRQSAIGLPFISHRTYGGREYDVTEYTMSEIIASVYDLMEETGVREGILFLDEINCVSETLSPLMLQFLQYKVFGGHRIPDGWIIVTAGNPPEYNESAREFDAVTLDRLKKIDVEPDYEAWKEYAVTAGVHPAVLAFLSSKKNCFYSVETTVDGRSIVTPRGWEDLSKMLILYERNELDVDEDLIVQYLQNAKTAREFAVYYDLYCKYRSEYPIDEILSGVITEEAAERAAGAGFDEVYTLIGLLISNVTSDIHDRLEEYRMLESLKSCIRKFGTEVSAGGRPSECIEAITDRLAAGREAGLKARTLSREESDRILRILSVLQEVSEKISDKHDAEDNYAIIRDGYSRRVDEHRDNVDITGERLSNLFRFAEQCWGDGKEMLMIVTELTADPDSVQFISKYGCDEYFAHNKDLLFNERELEIDQKLEELEIEE